MRVSDFELMAYVDAELGDKEHHMVARAIVATETLSRQARELQSLKQMLRMAYHSVPNKNEMPDPDGAVEDDPRPR